MKNTIFIIVLIVILAGAGYVLYTLNTGKVLDEPSPLADNTATEFSVVAGLDIDTFVVVDDNLDAMDEATKEQFMAEITKMQDSVVERDMTMPSEAQLVAAGEFMRRIHSVAGTAQLIQDGDETILRFEDFETDNGPLLHIYLSSDLGDDDFVDLGEIKATKGNINYTVPAGVDTEKYNNVLVWCVPFGVLFSYAELAAL